MNPDQFRAFEFVLAGFAVFTALAFLADFNLSLKERRRIRRSEELQRRSVLRNRGQKGQ